LDFFQLRLEITLKGGLVVFLTSEIFSPQLSFQYDGKLVRVNTKKTSVSGCS